MGRSTSLGRPFNAECSVRREKIDLSRQPATRLKSRALSPTEFLTRYNRHLIKVCFSAWSQLCWLRRGAQSVRGSGGTKRQHRATVGATHPLHQSKQCFVDYHDTCRGGKTRLASRSGPATLLVLMNKLSQALDTSPSGHGRDGPKADAVAMVQHSVERSQLEETRTSDSFHEATNVVSPTPSLIVDGDHQLNLQFAGRHGGGVLHAVRSHFTTAA